MDGWTTGRQIRTGKSLVLAHENQHLNTHDNH